MILQVRLAYWGVLAWVCPVSGVLIQSGSGVGASLPMLHHLDEMLGEGLPWSQGQGEMAAYGQLHEQVGKAESPARTPAEAVVGRLWTVRGRQVARGAWVVIHGTLGWGISGK